MPRDRFLRLPVEERDALLDVAARAFVAVGLEAASLNDILAEAGLSKGSYYYYFEDKLDLFATVIERAIHQVYTRAPMPSFERVTRAEFWPRVERHLTRWIAQWSGDVAQVVLFAHVDEAMRRTPRFAAIFSSSFAVYRPALEAGRRLGCVRTDLPVDELIDLIAAIDVVLDRRLQGKRAPMRAAELRRHMALVVDTVRRLVDVGRPSASRRRRHG
jgi:AcrR family transcriptional regulator